LTFNNAFLEEAILEVPKDDPYVDTTRGSYSLECMVQME
jgi:hypothetical protein